MNITQIEIFRKYAGYRSMAGFYFNRRVFLLDQHDVYDFVFRHMNSGFAFILGRAERNPPRSGREKIARGFKKSGFHFHFIIHIQHLTLNILESEEELLLLRGFVNDK